MAGVRSWVIKVLPTGTVMPPALWATDSAVTPNTGGVSVVGGGGSGGGSRLGGGGAGGGSVGLARMATGRGRGLGGGGGGGGSSARGGGAGRGGGEGAGRSTTSMLTVGGGLRVHLAGRARTTAAASAPCSARAASTPARLGKSLTEELTATRQHQGPGESTLIANLRTPARLMTSMTCTTAPWATTLSAAMIA